MEDRKFVYIHKRISFFFVFGFFGEYFTDNLTKNFFFFGYNFMIISVPALGVRALKQRVKRATSAHPKKRMNTRDPAKMKVKKRGIKKSRPGSAPARQTPTRNQASM